MASQHINTTNILISVAIAMIGWLLLESNSQGKLLAAAAVQDKAQERDIAQLRADYVELRAKVVQIDLELLRIKRGQ